MFRSARRLAARVIVTALLLGACSGQDEAEDAGGPSSTNPSTEGADGDTTSTTAGGGTSSTAGGSGPEPTSPPAGTDDEDGIIEIAIADGNVEGGVRRATVRQGAQVTIRTTTDAADELHVHTYDLRTDLVPGQSADITFLAKIPGVFEVELEKRGTKVLELEVRP